MKDIPKKQIVKKLAQSIELVPKRNPDCKHYHECLERAAKDNFLFACRNCAHYDNEPSQSADMVEIVKLSVGMGEIVNV